MINKSLITSYFAQKPAVGQSNQIQNKSLPQSKINFAENKPDTFSFKGNWEQAVWEQAEWEKAVWEKAG
jgi:hypothetical protein